MQWWYAINNQKFGPVEQELLSQMAKEGRIQPDTLVWNQSMGDKWGRAEAVPGLFAGGGLVPPPIASADVAPVAGSGGQTPNGDLTRQARECLKGNWGMAIVTTILYGIILVAAGLIPIASLIISGPMLLGLTMYFVGLARKQSPDIGVLFGGFKRFGVSLGAYLLMALFIILWTLPAITAGIICSVFLLHQALTAASLSPANIKLMAMLVALAAIPVVIAQLRYAMTFFVMVDKENVGPMEAINDSIALMKGNKLKLFCLGLRFVGWGFLCLLTFGIGFFWLGPYMFASYARFYDDLKSS